MDLSDLLEKRNKELNSNTVYSNKLITKNSKQYTVTMSDRVFFRQLNSKVQPPDKMKPFYLKAIALLGHDWVRAAEKEVLSDPSIRSHERTFYCCLYDELARRGAVTPRERKV